MKVIEISKQAKDKNGKSLSKQAAYKAGYYNIWDDERIKLGFNFGKGSKKDMQEYMANNAPYCYFEILEG